MFKTSLSAVINDAIFRLLWQEDAQCLPGPRSSTLLCYWRLLWNLLRLIGQVRGQPPKSISLTWRYLIYPGVSRGMRKNIVVLSGVSQLRLSVDPPQLALGASCQAAAVPLRQPRLCLSPGSAEAAAAFRCVSPLCPPPAEMQS